MSAPSTPPSSTWGRLEVRADEGLVLAGGRALVVSQREAALLEALVRNEGRVLSRRRLYELVWGAELRPGDRSVDVYVHKLRVKLEAAFPGTRFIHTHPGFGYRLSAEPSQHGHMPPDSG